MNLSDEFYFLSIVEVAERIRRREVSCLEVVRGQLERIDVLDAELRCYITVAREQALVAAKSADAALANGDTVGALQGVPIALKDVIDAEGLPTTANSRVLGSWIPGRDATVVARLKAAGAIIIGKLNLNEFAWSIPSDSDRYPPPRNPWNTKYAAIGSSSGSGAAIAAGLCFASLGTDAGGSVRLPAAACGLIGLKPTHGLFSRNGVLGCETIMDVGTLTRTAEDAALLLGVLAEKDSCDSARQAGTIRIGVPQREIEAAGVSPEIQTAFDQALREFDALDLKAHAVAPRWMTEARAANFIILNAEEYSLHKRNLRERLDDYGKSASLYLLQGAFLSNADYLIALEARSAVTEEIDRMFERVEILAMPVSPFTTPDEARAPAAHRRGVGAAFTAPFNLSGHPALSMPCGISSSGLPIGIQLVGRKGEEAVLLKVASSFQRHTAWTEHHPKLPAVLGRKPVPAEMH